MVQKYGCRWHAAILKCEGPESTTANLVAARLANPGGWRNETEEEFDEPEDNWVSSLDNYPSAESTDNRKFLIDQYQEDVAKGMAKGGKRGGAMTLASIRAAAKAKGYKLVKA